MEKKSNQYNLIFFIILISYTVGLIMLFVYWKTVRSFIGTILSPLEPFFVGIAIAYILNLPMRFLEERAFPFLFRNKNLNPKLIRIISMFLSFLFVLAVITAIIAILIPQISLSISTFISNFESYLSSLSSFFHNTLTFFNFDLSFFDQFESVWTSWLSSAIDVLKNSLPTIFNYTKDFTTGLVGGIVNTFVGIVICFYLLLTKEKLLRQAKKVLRAFLPIKTSNKIESIASYTHTTFAKFISGQLIEAFIVGVLCFIGMSVLGLPYALLISVIVGVTNMIPVVGPIIGAVPGGFILLMVNPIQCLWFVIFVIVLQQVESNLIYPHVVGNSVGLSGLWVMFAIFVGGGLFGFLGIFLGVPMFAVIYRLISEYINNRLQKKALQEAEKTCSNSSQKDS